MYVENSYNTKRTVYIDKNVNSPEDTNKTYMQQTLQSEYICEVDKNIIEEINRQCYNKR